MTVGTLPYLFRDEQFDKEFIKYKFLQWKIDPYRWFVEQLWTQDESKESDKLQLFPEKDYIWHVINEIRTNKVTVINKSRRMMATYINAGLCLHHLIFEPYSETVAVSIDQRSTRNLIQKRIIPMYDRLDKRFPYPQLKPKEHLQKASLQNPFNGSTVEAYPSGADKVRGLTLTFGFFDEVAFQKNVEENIRALRPALEGDACRAVLSSTPKLGTEFQKLVCNKAKDCEYGDLMPGLGKYLNDQNDVVLNLHYSADPRKDPKTEEGLIWYNRERFGKTPDGQIIVGSSGKSDFEWQQEYELAFSVPVGKQVLFEFDERLHCAPYSALGAYIPEKPLLVGFDFGGHYPACVMMQRDSLNRDIVHNALMAEDEELENFMIRVRDFIGTEFPGALSNLLIYCDPAGARKDGLGLSSSVAADMLGNFFRRPVRWSGYPKIVVTKPVDRARLINNKLAKKVHNAMGMIINPSAGIYYSKDGTVLRGLLVDGCKFGYIYKPLKKDQQYGAPEIYKDNFYDHMMDAWGYVVVNTSPMRFDNEHALVTHKPKKKKRYLVI